jgi:NAD(P)-dependent dehydrogenase (short-subunit alcohol dehydrogenase family)
MALATMPAQRPRSAALGAQVAYHGADMSKPADIEAMVKFAEEKFGRSTFW